MSVKEPYSCAQKQMRTTPDGLFLHVTVLCVLSNENVQCGT